MSDATDVVDAQIAAYRDRDLERFLSCYAEEITIGDFDGNVLMDRESMRQQYGEMFRASPDLSIQIVSRITLGQLVVDEEAVDGLVSPGLPPQGRAVAVYRVSDGLIRQVMLLMN